MTKRIVSALLALLLVVGMAAATAEILRIQPDDNYFYRGYVQIEVTTPKGKWIRSGMDFKSKDNKIVLCPPGQRVHCWQAYEGDWWFVEADVGENTYFGYMVLDPATCGDGEKDTFIVIPDPENVIR